MPKICFEIEVDSDTGEVMAGVCPPEEDETEKAHLQPVAGLDDALTMARETLAGEQEAGRETGARNNSMMRGYSNVAKPGGMMRGEGV